MDLEELHAKIDAYIKGELSAEEKLAFDQQIRENDEIKQELLVHLLANESISLMVEDEVRKKLDKIRPTVVPLWRRPAVKWAIAACVIGVVSLISYTTILRPNQEEKHRYTEQLQSLTRISVLDQKMGDGTDVSSLECIKAYDDHNYNEALQCFDQQPDKNTVQIQEFMAHCYLKMEQYSEASTRFESLLKREEVRKEPDLNTAIEWNWMIALAGQRESRLEPLLDSVLKIPTYKYYEEAQQLQNLVSSEE